LSGVAVEALSFAFDVAADGTAVAGARLEIEATAGPELELTALEVLDAAPDR
jgi:Zn finger protein HypA/HybF involved in hydrogenase expression